MPATRTGQLELPLPGPPAYPGPDEAAHGSHAVDEREANAGLLPRKEHRRPGEERACSAAGDWGWWVSCMRMRQLDRGRDCIASPSLTFEGAPCTLMHTAAFKQLPTRTMERPAEAAGEGEQGKGQARPSQPQRQRQRCHGGSCAQDWDTRVAVPLVGSLCQACVHIHASRRG